MSRWDSMFQALDAAEALTGTASRWADIGHQARYGAGRLYGGVRGIARETGGSGRWDTGVAVGRFLGFETAGDVEVSLDKLDTDMSVFESELAVQAHASPGLPIATFYASVWSPFYERWKTFYSKNKTWFMNFWRDNRHERDGFLSQLQQMRDQAKALGASVMSPAPSVPAAAPDPLGAVWSLVKIAVYVALGIAGIFALLFAWKAMRG